MNLFQIGKVSLVLLGVVAVLGAVTVAQATPISFSGSYDGSYDPYSGSPPAGQSTWQQGTAGITPVPNDDNGTPTAGVANFNDLLTTTRVSAYRLMGAGTFQSDQSQDEYTYTTQIKLYDSDVDKTEIAVLSIGFRDEWSGGTDWGKVAMLGWCYLDTKDHTPGLWLVGATTGWSPNSPLKINSVNYFDNAWHTYRVDKYIDPADSVTKVKVYVDNVLAATRNYSDLPNATSGGNGFGYFGGTAYTDRATVDYFQYGALVPEPSTLALLATGLIGLLAYAWRRRK